MKHQKSAPASMRLNILPLISALFLTFASCSPNYFTNDGQTWGTYYHIVYSSDRDLSDSVVSEMQTLDATLSKFNPGSEVSRINRGETDEVSPAFAEVFALSQKINRLSGGLYDPTVGPLCELWGFGRAEFDSIPSDSAITIALEGTGIDRCRIDGGKLILKSSRTEFDFSSVAKGYGIDCIAAMLERNGAENYMIEIGGEIYARGFSPKKKPWRIQIDAPESTDDPATLHTRLQLLELGPEPVAVATSGNYRNYRQAGGERFGHTISPVTGYPARTENLSATIIAPTCALADALATACMALPDATSATAIARQSGAEAMIVTLNPDSSYRFSFTPAFLNHIAD